MIDHCETTPHLMHAEGTATCEPTDDEIRAKLNGAGYGAYRIDSSFDTFQQVWRWTCSITLNQYVLDDTPQHADKEE